MPSCARLKVKVFSPEAQRQDKAGLSRAWKDTVHWFSYQSIDLRLAHIQNAKVLRKGLLTIWTCLLKMMWEIFLSQKRFTFIFFCFSRSDCSASLPPGERRLNSFSLCFPPVCRGQTLNRIFASHFKIHGDSKKAEHQMSNLNVASDGGQSSGNKRRKQREGRSGGEFSLVGWSETIRSVQLWHGVRAWKTLNRDTAQRESALRARSVRSRAWTCCSQRKSTWRTTRVGAWSVLI